MSAAAGARAGKEEGCRPCLVQALERRMEQECSVQPRSGSLSQGLNLLSKAGDEGIYEMKELQQWAGRRGDCEEHTVSYHSTVNVGT